jgi:hypothetical protein
VEFVEKKDFSKLFPRKIAIFPNIFWGEKFPRNFAWKNVRKIGPRSRRWGTLPDREGGELDQLEKVGNFTRSRRWGTLPDREGGELYQIEKVGNFTRSRRWGTLHMLHYGRSLKSSSLWFCTYTYIGI